MENRFYSQTPSENFVSDKGNVKQYIKAASSLLVPAIIGLVLSPSIPLAGIILSIIVKSKIAKLPLVDESVLDETTLAEYKPAAEKAKTAGTLALIALIISAVFIGICALSFVIGIVLGFLSAM